MHTHKSYHIWMKILQKKLGFYFLEKIFIIEVWNFSRSKNAQTNPCSGNIRSDSFETNKAKGHVILDQKQKKRPFSRNSKFFNLNFWAKNPDFHPRRKSNFCITNTQFLGQNLIPHSVFSLKNVQVVVENPKNLIRWPYFSF